MVKSVHLDGRISRGDALNGYGLNASNLLSGATSQRPDTRNGVAGTLITVDMPRLGAALIHVE
jgi:hypothetical protein